MVDSNDTFLHHLLQLPVADGLSHIPADAPMEEISLKLAALEIHHRPFAV